MIRLGVGGRMTPKPILSPNDRSCIASIVRIAYAIYHATLRNDDHTWKAFYSNLWA